MTDTLERADFRVLVCGDRNWYDQALIDRTLDEIHSKTLISLLIEGEANGADRMGRSWAERRHVPFAAYPAEWKRYGRAAGAIRNRKQFNEGEPDLVLAFHDSIESSRGTKDMLGYAKQKGCPTRLIRHNPFGGAAYRKEA